MLTAGGTEVPGWLSGRLLGSVRTNLCKCPHLASEPGSSLTSNKALTTAPVGCQSLPGWIPACQTKL